MEELDNRQMVLLTMFTSFVVSIATGIITVAMLQEAPETLTQTVNRVVEHTIERVVTGTTTPDRSTPATITNVTKETTIYAKEDDLVVSAVEKNQPRVARIYSSGSATSSLPRAIGFVVSRDGLIATEPTSLLVEGVMGEKYVVMVGGEQYTAVPTGGQDASKQPIFFLKITDLSASSTLNSVTYGRNENPKLAQTAVVLGGTDGFGVFKTTLSRFHFTTSESTTTPANTLVAIETTPRIPEQYTGGLVVNLDGQAIGIVILASTDSNEYVIYPVSRILEFVGATPSQSAGTTPRDQDAA